MIDEAICPHLKVTAHCALPPGGTASTSGADQVPPGWVTGCRRQGAAVGFCTTRVCVAGVRTGVANMSTLAWAAAATAAPLSVSRQSGAPSIRHRAWSCAHSHEGYLPKFLIRLLPVSLC